MRVLVTGGAGYIGSVLTRNLLRSGHEVTVLDALLFGRDSVRELRGKSRYTLVEGDIRDDGLVSRLVRGKDAVVHLAAIVGDPACAGNPEVAKSVNVEGTEVIARAAQRAGVGRFVFASTCSVYGHNDETVDESSGFNPQSLYAETRMAGETIVGKLASRSFQPVTLRFGTVYGLSPRMRFDLVVNFLTAELFRKGVISIFGGDQWRPFLHVADAARAVQLAVESPAHLVAGEIFNIGSEEQNYQLKDLMPIYARLKPKASITCVREVKDRRSYRVNFDKIRRVLRFSSSFTVPTGVRQIFDLLASPSAWDLNSEKHYNHKVALDRIEVVHQNELTVPNPISSNQLWRGREASAH
ncbi:MAG: SDR family oxidoreductase [Methanothrix sp.]|nr:SDR family oxidoreductase [Methanothrix sp.]